MSDTGFWNPAEQNAPDLDLMRRWAAAVPEDLVDPGEVITGTERASHSGLMQQPRERWEPVAQALTVEELVALVRLFTLAEMTFAGWRGDNGSPVIAFARELRSRQEWPSDLTGWIRSRSDNRFLPYGSLMDRLG